ncbi:MAG: TIGR01777 family oxidoreductase [Bryobacteraceae bacterium]
MNYLITGASGFIGTKLVDFLLAREEMVNYLARKRSRALDSRAAFHYWNPEEQLELKTVPRLDAVIHLAGEPIAQRWTTEVKRSIYESRVKGTRELVSAIGELKYKPSVLVSASAIGYYGDRGDEVLTETSAPGAGFLPEVCVHWEEEARRANEFGVRAVPIRIATVLGRGGGALDKMLTPFRLGLGGKFGNGRQWMSWIHVDDLVQLLVFASETASATSALNGSSPHPVTNAEFTTALARALHRPAILAMPRFALKLAMGEMADVLFSSARVIPEGVERGGFRFRYPELDRALVNILG